MRIKHKDTYENLREVAIDIVKNEKIFFGEDLTTSEEREKIHSLLSALKSALAESPRNCDVGTAEEQIRRIRSHCKQHRVGLRCVDCSVKGVFPKDCALIWAQMPYEKGGAE